MAPFTNMDLLQSGQFLLNSTTCIIYFILIKCRGIELPSFLGFLSLLIKNKKFNENDLLTALNKEVDILIDEINGSSQIGIAEKNNQILFLNQFKSNLAKKNISFKEKTIQKLSDIKLLSKQDKKDEIFNSIKIDFLNFKGIDDNLKNKIIDRFDQRAFEIFKNWAKTDIQVFQSVAIKFFEQLSEQERKSHLEIIKHLIGNEKATQELSDKISELTKSLDEISSRKYPQVFAEISENSNFIRSDLCIIYSKIKNEDIEDIGNLYLNLMYENIGNKEYSKGIQSIILRKGISQKTTKKILELPTFKNHFDVLYWMTDIYHLLDDYKLAFKTISKCETIVENEHNINDINDIKLIKAHIITHLNEFGNAKNLYKIVMENTSNFEDPKHKLQKCECLFRLGELALLTGYFKESKNKLNESINLTREIKEGISSIELEHTKASRFEGDCLRRLGTTHLMEKNWDDASLCFKGSQNIYNSIRSDRGGVWILHEKAELYRQINNENNKYSRSKELYEKAVEESFRVFNFNRVLHGMFGLAEIDRLNGNPKLSDYKNIQKAYEGLNSQWGMINTDICMSLIKLSSNETKEGNQLIEDAKAKAKLFGFKFEEKICEEIMELDINEYATYKYPFSHF